MTLPQFSAQNMPLKSALFLRACCLVGALFFCRALAAEGKSSLIGATRAEVLARLGEPKSNIVAGSREMLFFAGDRVVLRDGRVIEVEEIPFDAAPAVPRQPANTAVPATDATIAEAGSDARAPNAPDAVDATKPATGADGMATDVAAMSTAVVSAPREPEVQIKSIRPPSRSRVPPEPVVAPSAPAIAGSMAKVPAAATGTPAPAVTVSVAPSPSVAGAQPAAGSPATGAPQAVESTTPAEPAAAPPGGPRAPNLAAETMAIASVGAEVADGNVTVAAATTASVEAGAHEGAKSNDPTKAAPPTKRAVRIESDTDDASASLFATRTYVLAFLTIAGGMGYLTWRWRNRRLELEATAVSHPPFAVDAGASGTATRFTPELLGRLEWKHFEDLVIAYYNKTGVVAARTKSGPAGAVNIRISWKGEPRPFACVRCIAHAPGLVEAKPIQELCEVIAAEGIRRGYVVSTGKFSVPARDLAEEKHITLLSGDILLEKINALPEPVRAELLREVTTGDYMTPSCHQCEVKLARSPADATVWQCPQCGTALPRS